MSHRKVWTKEEIKYLKENLGRLKVSTIADNLGRTYDAVKVKMTRLGLSNTKAFTGMVTIGELASILKVDRNTVLGWVQRHNLKCTAKVTRKSKRFYCISQDDFWYWARYNKDKVNFSKIDPFSLVPEPSWVKEERITHYEEENPYQIYRKWTTLENQKMKYLIRKGYSYKEVAEQLNRTPLSVQRRHQRNSGDSHPSTGACHHPKFVE